MTMPKRGGARPGAGQPRKSADQSVSVRFSLALTPAEADEYRRRGAGPWVRRMLRQSQEPTYWWVVCHENDDAHVYQRLRPHGIVIGPFETHDELIAATYNRPYRSDWLGLPKCDVCAVATNMGLK